MYNLKIFFSFKVITSLDIIFSVKNMGCRQEERQLILVLSFRGSNPLAPDCYCLTLKIITQNLFYLKIYDLSYSEASRSLYNI